MTTKEFLEGLLIVGVVFGIPIGAMILHNPQIKEVTQTNLVRTDDYSTTRTFADTGDMDCSDFDSQYEAQDFFESEGGPDEDFHNLDRDGDGEVCETLP